MAKRKEPSKTELIARLHRGLRPKLVRGQRRDLALCHIQNLDAIAKGEGNEDILWHWVGGVLTWSRVAQHLGVGVDEMAEQLQLSTRVIDRYRATGRIVFTGPDYQLAKTGVDVMDQLADKVDRPTAIAAADWSEAKITEMSAECAQQRAA